MKVFLNSGNTFAMKTSISFLPDAHSKTPRQSYTGL